MSSGFVCLWRECERHEIWAKPPAYFKIFAWMWMQAHWGDEPYRHAGVDLQKGQFISSVRDCADACRIPRSTAHRVWKWLKKRDSIRDTQLGKRGTLVEVRNYSKWNDLQSRSDKVWDSKTAVGGTEGGTQVGQYKPEEPRNQDLFPPPPPPAEVVAVGRFLEQTNTRWSIQTPIRQWVQERILSNGRFAGVDVSWEMDNAIEWVQGNGKKLKQPSRFILGWLDRAAAQTKADKRKTKGPTYVNRRDLA